MNNNNGKIKIDGVGVIGMFPKVGGGCINAVGSDRYGYTIIEVSRDGKMFKYCPSDSSNNSYTNDGFAAPCDYFVGIFVTRKNSKHFGRYVEACWNGKKYVATPTIKGVGCENINRICITNEPAKTELDPCF